VARGFIKGTGSLYGNYFSPGFNIVKRVQRGEVPDDSVDLFEYLGYSKTEKGAIEKAKGLGKVEIMKFKVGASPK
jgi:hypothetical protein